RVIPTQFIAIGPTPGHEPRPENFASTCFLETPLINPNGDVSACHAGKAGAFGNFNELAYYLGNLHEKSFAEVMADAAGNGEYQFLRAYGPQGVARILAETPEVKALFGGKTFTNGCDLCFKVLRSRAGRARLRELVADPFQRELAAAVCGVRYGDGTE